MRFRQLLPLFGALFALYIYLGLNLFCHSNWRGKLASVNDGRRSIPGSRYFIAGIFATARTQAPRYVRCSMPR